ncbi:DUF262 domain-containing protein [Herbiconiux sp. P17]|uniref:DUF262 domain-containing protein n=1 Tax=Herbiconiux wuyangfengii TaxID=3342794 RepID=UPI0035B9AF0D
MSELSAHEVALHKVFSSDYEFTVPAYQRPYAWNPEQAQELLDDLIDASRREGAEPYFLGSLVLVKEKERPRSEVIDGQQRLTTLTILLALLRDLTADENIRSDLDAMVRQPEKVIMGLAAKPRLTLRPKDREFFARAVQRPGATVRLLGMSAQELQTDAQRAIQSNARVLRDALRRWSDAERLRLVQMLATRTYLVAVSTPDLDSAHRIFGVMNARGLDLSPADIFKSQVIGALHSSGLDPDAYAGKWEDAEELIGRDDFADLFLHIRLLESKQRARLGLLREFPEQVLNHYLPSDAARFVDDVVVPSARAYQQIRDQTYTAPSGAAAVNAWFQRLEQLDNNDWRSVALWALRRNPGDPVWLDRFLRRLERLAASMFLRREWTTPRVTRYIDLLRQLESGRYELDAPAFELSPPEQRETLAALDGEVYLSPKTRKYVLLRLDECLSGASGATYSPPLVTVEHVLPQKPPGGSEWFEAFSDLERARWTHRLANLVLLNRVKNSEAQNLDFVAKKAKYFSGKRGVSVFALTSQVLAEERWTPAVLETRQRALLSVLAGEWGLAPR